MKEKLWKAIDQIKETNNEVKELELELEIVNEENEYLEKKLKDKNQDFVEMKRKYEKEKAENEKKDN